MEEDTVRFDQENLLRLLDEETLKSSEQLKGETQEFLSKLSRFDKLVGSFLQVMEFKAQQIEKEKLKAIGQRNRLEGQQEMRRRKQRELEGLINEKQAQIDRLVEEHESLTRLETEQRLLIEKLTRNDM